MAAWAGAVDGDAEGFTAVYDRNLDRTYRHALRLAGSRHDAEDLTAGAFMELWRRRKHVRVVDGSVLPWLLVTVTNLERNRARSLRRYRSFLASLPRTEATSPAADSLVAESATDGVVKDIRKALRRLNPADATLIALVAFEGYTSAQAAQALGISQGAARTRLHRARRRIGSELAWGPNQAGWTALNVEDRK